MAQRYCEKCNKMLNEREFYRSNNLEKYPDEKLNICKKCLTMHLDCWDPETFKWILEELDLPYIKKEWDDSVKKALEKTTPEKMNGTTVLGRYISKMKLNQHKHLRWADTDRLVEKARQDKIEGMRIQGYSDQEIEEAIAKPTEDDIPMEKPEMRPADIESPGVQIDRDDNEFVDEFADQLTTEEKMAMKLKWGRGYTTEEWIRLETLYNDMMRSYDIQGAGMRDTLIMICKASVKANQFINAGDTDNFQKMTKVYNDLMKSARLTAAQIKDTGVDSIDSVGELVALCEKEGFIPRYYIDGPQDHADRTLQDMQSYTRTLVTEELNLGDLIESAVKDIEADRAKEAIIDTDDYDSPDDNAFEESLFKEKQYESTLKDYEEFEEFKESAIQQDLEELNNGTE